MTPDPHEAVVPACSPGPGATRADRRDRELERTFADLLEHDDRLAGGLRARFDAGVAHLTGRVGCPAELVTARELIGRLAGVHGVWDLVRVGDRPPPRALDLGCGAVRQHPGNAGIDRRRTTAVHVVADLARGIPVADAAVDRVYAVHVLEHLPDYLPLLAECHRVLRPDGVLHLLSPWWRHVNAVADPTHLRFFDVQTIKGICAQAPGGRRWFPELASCDGATVFADLRPLGPGDPDPDPHWLARFFD
ncbi:MAG TPA: methyltransferase domain-containing protein [Kineosporiaceae bacterium]|nr:methyltransferase domain-containing protein [Kineosporiaceae bacterium]